MEFFNNHGGGGDFFAPFRSDSQKILGERPSPLFPLLLTLCMQNELWLCFVHVNHQRIYSNYILISMLKLTIYICHFEMVHPVFSVIFGNEELLFNNLATGSRKISWSVKTTGSGTGGYSHALARASKVNKNRSLFFTFFLKLTKNAKKNSSYFQKVRSYMESKMTK